MITKALVIERAIFFVLLPFFRFNGDAGLRTVSADISRDEQIHVATNSLVCHDMGLSWSSSLDKLRKATINWIMEPLGKNTYGDKYLSKKFWLDSSDRLMYERQSSRAFGTKSARMPAFFEHSKCQSPPILLSPQLRTKLRAVLSELEEIYPPTNPNFDESMERIMYRSGQRSVVEWIKVGEDNGIRNLNQGILNGRPRRKQRNSVIGNGMKSSSYE